MIRAIYSLRSALLGIAAALCGLIASASIANAQPPADPKITCAAEIFLEGILAEEREQQVDPNSQAARLGAAFDVAEKFLSLTPEDMLNSPSLTDRSRDLLPTSPGRQRLAHLVEIDEANPSGQIVDARFAGENIATIIRVCSPRPSHQPKRIVTLDLVRKYDDWQVTLDLEADAVLPLGDAAPAYIAALRKTTDKRVAEITSVIERPLDEPLPFHGTWTTHFAQAFVCLSFDTTGKAFTLRVEEGASSYGVFDYHLTDDEVVIEARMIPIRLKRHAGDNNFEHNGERFETMRIDDPRIWFPECRDPLFLQPIPPEDLPITRPPTTPGEPASAGGSAK